MKWTGWGEPRAEAWAVEMLARLRANILDRWGGLLQGILVVGGFGRGEGSVLRTTEGTFRPWNDVDLVLIRKPGAPVPADFDLPALTWAVELGLDSVDIAWASQEEWRGEPQSLFHAEVARGHRVLWGDGAAADSLPLELGKAARVAETHRLLANRGYALLLWALHPQVEESDERLSFRLNILVKLDMAVGDARLLLAGRLPVHYSDRPASFRDSDGPPELRMRHAEAVENKLRPTEEWAQRPRDSASEIYAAARRWLDHGPLALTGRTSEEYPGFVAHELGSWRRRLKNRLSGTGAGLDPRLKLDASLPLLLEGLCERRQWRPGPLVSLWPDRLSNESEWEACASALTYEWKEGK